ncbi:RluA family pseudouridine synthase [Haliangium sp.]|uniref:RluA family pseudouridine synthase n=1 Tax=Haliangium sp. TaxID=2663208 RepID=UPI003D12D2EF
MSPDPRPPHRDPPETRFRAPRADRADKLVAAHFGVSRRRVTALFEARAVRADGRRVDKGTLVEAGAELCISASPARDADLSPRPQPGPGDPGDNIDVLYEDPLVVAMNKPAGMPSHPLRAGEIGTLANALVARFPDCAGVGADPREAGLVHRLDTDTTGVVCAARRAEAWTALRRAFTAGAVDKLYWALVRGQPRGDGSDAPLRRRGPGRMDIAAAGTPGALPAETRWQVLERLGPFTLLACRCHSGRMHQVRIHLAAAGAPIVGDRSYGDPDSPPPLPVPVRGHFLHARAITFPHPDDGRRLTIEAPLPRDRDQALAALRRPDP